MASLFALADRLDLIIQPGLDVDAVVIGPNGIWVLESKYWLGLIRCREGQWERWRDGVWEPIPEDKAPDRQWLLEARAVRDQLRALPDWARRVRGGVAFTHPLAHLDVENPRAERRTVEDWVRLIRMSEPIPELADPARRLQAADRLLEGHRQTLSLPARSAWEWARFLLQEACSARELARFLVQEADERLKDAKASLAEMEAELRKVEEELAAEAYDRPDGGG